eukprot:PhF_6_TR36504/c0_g2_i9/m.53710
MQRRVFIPSIFVNVALLSLLWFSFRVSRETNLTHDMNQVVVKTTSVQQPKLRDNDLQQNRIQTSLKTSIQKIHPSAYLVTNVCIDGTPSSSSAIAMSSFDHHDHHDGGTESPLSGPASFTLPYKNDVMSTMLASFHVNQSVLRGRRNVTWKPRGVLHWIQKRYMANIAHTSNAISAQWNSIRRAWGGGQTDDDILLSIPWVVLSTSSQYDTKPNFYRHYLEGGHPDVLFTASTVNTSSVQCFREVLVGYEHYEIVARPQDVRLLRRYVERYLSNCTHRRRTKDVYFIQRRESRRFEKLKGIQRVTGGILFGDEDGESNARVLDIDLSRLRFREQLCLFQKASVIIGVHGAGLAMAFVMRPRSVLIQVCPFKAPAICRWYQNVVRSIGVPSLKYLTYIVVQSEVTHRVSKDLTNDVKLNEVRWSNFLSAHVGTLL